MIAGAGGATGWHADHPGPSPPTPREQHQTRGDIGEHHQTQHRPERRARRAAQHRPQIDRRHLLEHLEADRREQRRPASSSRRLTFSRQPGDHPGEQQPRHQHRHQDRDQPRRSRRTPKLRYAQAISAARPSAPAWPSAVSATVATITTNVDTIANRSDSLVRTKPGDSMRAAHHISVNASRRCAHPAQARPRRGGQTDDADRRARVDRRIHQLDQLLTQRTGHRGLILSSIVLSSSRPPRQHKSDRRETDHQQGEQRENRVVREPGREEVALASRRTSSLARIDVVEPSEPRPQPIEDPGLAGSLIARLPRVLSAVSAGTRAGHRPARPSSRPRRRRAPRPAGQHGLQFGGIGEQFVDPGLDRGHELDDGLGGVLLQIAVTAPGIPVDRACRCRRR